MAQTATARESAADLRRTMVERQMRTFDVFDVGVLAAFDATPREPFIAADLAAVAYSDRVLPGRTGERLLLAPMILGRLIQEAAVTSQCRALDVAGGGYSAAVLSRLVKSVVAIEDEPEAAQAAAAQLGALGCANVAARQGDLAKGAPSDGPFDVILVNGVVETGLDGLLAQLADGGRLLTLEKSGSAVRAVRYDRHGEDVGKRTLFNASGPALAAFGKAPAFIF